MDSTISRTNVLQSGYVHPGSIYLNKWNKDILYNAYKSQVFGIWVVPMLLTFGEMASLKHGNMIKANQLGLCKWIAIILAYSATYLQQKKLLHKFEYFNMKFPFPSQAQIQMESRM